GIRAVPWQPPAGQHLPSNWISSLLAARDGTLWIGADKGLASWKDGKLTRRMELTEQFIVRLLEDREGTVWAGSIGIPSGRLCAIHNGSVQCQGGDGSLGRGVVGLYEDRKGNLWAGVADGLWRWRPGPPKFHPVPDALDSIQGFGEANDGALLIGARSGIRRLVGEKTEAYPLPGRVPQFGIPKLLRDHDGGLWIGTSVRGLVHVRQGRTDVFARSDGLSGDDVYALFEDREGNIWVSTSRGLDRFRDLAVVTIDVNQGMSNDQVVAVLAARDGGIWLATLSGLNRWNN